MRERRDLMSQIELEIIDILNNRRLSVTLPNDVPLEQLIPALVRKLGLLEGEYALKVEGQDKNLATETTLAESSVNEGCVLCLDRAPPETPILKPIPTPASLPTLQSVTHKTKMPSWLWVVGVMILIAGLLLAGGFIIASSIKQANATTMDAWVEQRINTAEAVNAEETATAQAKAEVQAAATGTARVYQVTQTEGAVITQTAMAQQAATAHAEATVAKATFQAVPANWPIHFQDSFGKSDDKWPIGERELEQITLLMTISNGVYRVEADAHQDVSITLTHPMEPVSDIHVSADVLQISGSGIRQFGIVYRFSDFENHGFFGITGDGHFLVYVKKDGKYDFVINKTPSALVQSGSRNYLNVIVDNNHYQFFINGEMVGEVNDDRLSGGKGGFGFSLVKGSSAVFEFDNFVIRAK